MTIVLLRMPVVRWCDVFFHDCHAIAPLSQPSCDNRPCDHVRLSNVEVQLYWDDYNWLPSLLKRGTEEDVVHNNKIYFLVVKNKFGSGVSVWGKSTPINSYNIDIADIVDGKRFSVNAKRPTHSRTYVVRAHATHRAFGTFLFMFLFCVVVVLYVVKNYNKII